MILLRLELICLVVIVIEFGQVIQAVLREAIRFDHLIHFNSLIQHVICPSKGQLSSLRINTFKNKRITGNARWLIDFPFKILYPPCLTTQKFPCYRPLFNLPLYYVPMITITK